MSSRLYERIEDFRNHAGLPELIAGGTTLILGNAVVQFTSSNPELAADKPSVHEVAGLSITGAATIAAMGLVSVIRRRHQPAQLAENIDSASSDQNDGQ